MSFDNTVLPDILIADLYKNVFLLGEDVAPLKFLGSNLKKIVILVKQPADIFLPERHLEFLSKILGACKLNIGDVAILNLGFKFAEIKTIKQQLKPDHIILFDVEPIELKLPLTFPYFKIQNYADTAYLSAPNLDSLNSDTDEGKLLKTKLWVCLKTLFEVGDPQQ